MENFVFRQKELLSLERSAFARKRLLEVQELGHSLQVTVVKKLVPVYGGTIVSFKSLLSKTEAKVPAFRLGNLVGVDLLDGSNLLNGILLNVSGDVFSVHVRDSEDIFKESQVFELIKTNDEGEFEQLELSLDGILEKPTKLRDILFGIAVTSKLSSDKKCNQFVVINEKLDESQKAAVQMANGQEELAVIHGPPGTGKTTTLVEIISQVNPISTTRLCSSTFIFYRQLEGGKRFFSQPQAMQLWIILQSTLFPNP